MKKPDLRGVTVATVLPFKDDLSIDWDGYARLLDYCACPDGIAAVFVNGHAGEGGSLSDEERQAVIARTRAHIGANRCLPASSRTRPRTRSARPWSAEAAGATARCCSHLLPSAAVHRPRRARRSPSCERLARQSQSRCLSSSIRWRQVSATRRRRSGNGAIDRVIAVKEGSDTISLMTRTGGP